jgi:hypothetical protein
MMRILRTETLIAVLVALVCVSIAETGAAQDIQTDRPMYKAVPPHNDFRNSEPSEPTVQLPQWTFTWESSYDNQTFNTVIVGTDPAKTDTTTTVTVAIVPIKMVYGQNNGNMTFDPASPYYKTYSTTQLIADSLIFKPEFDFDQGGTDLGKTQYLDAYQRSNFWGSVKTNTNYHLLFKAVVGPEQTFKVPAGTGDVITVSIAPGKVGTADINWFDAQLQALIQKFHKIQPNVLPLFITYQVYLTENGGCCIGGYHSALAGPPNGQTYIYSTTMNQFSNGQEAFSQDVGGLSHEMGGWLMDPFVDNSSPCPGNILEVGNPTDGSPNYGGYPYTIGGFTFYPQDLVFITWFGAPAATSLDVWNGITQDVTTFQNEALAVCQTP